MYCQNCGKQMEEGATFCSECGSSLQNQNTYTTSNGYTTSNSYAASFEMDSQKKGTAIAALVLGIFGLLAWIIPIVGLPVGIVGLVLGIKGSKKSGKGMAIAGIVLSTICLILTIINGAIGAYQGYKGEAWFQQDKVFQESEKNEFTIRDDKGNILMSGGIETVELKSLDLANGEKQYAAEIQFSDSAAEKLTQITAEHIGEQLGMYLNDKRILNAYVQSQVEDGICQITAESQSLANELVQSLRKCI